MVRRLSAGGGAGEIVKRAALLSIRIYRALLSPWIPASCRFVPTCSRYAEESIERFGLPRGILLAVKRLVHCHPWGSHGYDPVPYGGHGSPKKGRG